MRASAAAEETTEKHPVTPGPTGPESAPTTDGS